MVWKCLKWFKDLWSWANIFWTLASLLGFAGALTSIGGTVLAAMNGVPLPIAVMVGFCAFVATIYLALAPLVYRTLILLGNSTASAGSVSTDVLLAAKDAVTTTSSAPNYDAIRHIEEFEIGVAAKLWCELDPRASRTPAIASWADAFVAAARRGELEVVTHWPHDPEMLEHEQNNPDTGTLVTKKSLREFAIANGHELPRFLREP
jgi:hypothetical protein